MCAVVRPFGPLTDSRQGAGPRRAKKLAWVRFHRAGARMTNPSHFPAITDRRGHSSWLAMLAGLVFLVLALNVGAQAPAAPGGVATPPSPEELDKLVGPIALYPD